MKEGRDLWGHLVIEGSPFNENIFQLFDALGERKVMAENYVGEFASHRDHWLRLRDEAKTEEAALAQVEAAALGERQVKASERQAREARLSRKIAYASLLVAILALALSAIALSAGR